MRNLNRTHKALLLFLSLFVFSCAATNAPRGWLESPKDIQANTYGGWLNLETKTEAKLAGELIAINNDSIFIAYETFHAIARSDIKSARLVVYKSKAGAMGGLVLLGTLSTASNGFLLILTAPLWILGGSIATLARSFEPIINYPKQDLSNFVPFARFPQGLPVEIDRSKIKMKYGG